TCVPTVVEQCVVGPLRDSAAAIDVEAKRFVFEAAAGVAHLGMARLVLQRGRRTRLRRVLVLVLRLRWALRWWRGLLRRRRALLRRSGRCRLCALLLRWFLRMCRRPRRPTALLWCRCSLIGRCILRGGCRRGGQQAQRDSRP